MARARAANQPLLVLDGGGTFLKKPEDAANAPQTEPVAATMIEALGMIGYDALNLGPHDLLLPPEQLRRLAGAAAFPFLSANIVDSAGRPPFTRSIVKVIDGQRIGILGLAGDQKLPLAGLPGRDLVVQDPIAAARSVVGELRRNCSLVIVLSQLGLENDVLLARKVPGIDVILGGFTRQVTAAPRFEGQTIIVHAGAKGMRLGVLEIAVLPGRSGPWKSRASSPAGGARVYGWNPVPLDTSLPDDPALTALLDRHRAATREHQLAEQALQPPPAGDSAYVGATACARCHLAQFVQWKGSRHARALASLERKRQDLEPGCLKCHVTAYGDPAGYRPGAPGPGNLADVQCEACHGFGREHRGRDRRIRGQVPEAICRRCHSTENSPTFKYEPYLRKLGGHAAAYFSRQDAAKHQPQR